MALRRSNSISLFCFNFIPEPRGDWDKTKKMKEEEK
jgi:hypothetical protein